ncbi:hypothetical protein COCSADRAFT_189427 [Bipolaris sorokiniana ND90Pr]|uniref:mitogen-activated protein kinase kinase n=1 Tax=Cochliobolus sativus (strain ND90Pr / ATCC 201652) TaxID=665912 RepID=M2T8T9_COCSN|nr:uncharacterized protein COCSADRAFT_189427 [Bipolaris sorokiniana ND90Pr]EMD65666.1 hypothetical protein COCSADRAFT_189427 [Bipolaris sorokiniana ND90Pr]
MSLNDDLASEDHDSKRYVRELEALAKFAQPRTMAGYICMEYCKYLDLRKHLKSYGVLPEESARAIALQVLQGLVQMHGNKIAHRDLKPAYSKLHGSRDHWAPFLGRPNDADPFRVDIWCLGETIACGLTGQTSVDAIDFVRSLLQADPLRRPTAAQALNHPWIKGNRALQSQTRKDLTGSTTNRTENASNQEFTTVDRITEASAQWTQTVPMRVNETNTQPGSSMRTAAPPIVIPNLSDRPTVPQRTSARETARGDLPKQMYPTTDDIRLFEQAQRPLVSGRTKIKRSQKFENFSKEFLIANPIPAHNEEKQRQIEGAQKWMKQNVNRMDYSNKHDNGFFANLTKRIRNLKTKESHASTSDSQKKSTVATPPPTLQPVYASSPTAVFFARGSEPKLEKSDISLPYDREEKLLRHDSI